MYTVAKEIVPEKVNMKDVFGLTMKELASGDPDVVYFDSDLVNSIGMAGFSREFPARTVDCGIQEANMISAASGASLLGVKPYVHTFGTFASRRVMDQVFISAAYAKANIRIFGSDAGVNAATNGGTHMPLEDIAMMRAIPSITIMEATDCAMLADLMRQVKDRYGVFYIRMARKIVDHVYEKGSSFEIGKSVKLRNGTDVTLFASGCCVADSIKAADLLEKQGISAAVQNMFTIKPIDSDAVVRAAETTGAIVTAENHNIMNGLGSAVAEVLVEKKPVPMERVGVHDVFGEVGSIGYLKKTFHMTPEDIAEAAKRAIARKN